MSFLIRMQVTRSGLVPNEGSEALAWEEVAVLSGGMLSTVKFSVFVTQLVFFGVLVMGNFIVLSPLFPFSYFLFSAVILLVLL